MIEETKEGFKLLVGTNGSKRFMMDSDRLEECIRYIRSNRITDIGINSYIGFRSTDLSFLSTLADLVESISIPEARYDLAVLHSLHKLKMLGFSDDGKSVIDLANFPGLRELACEFSPRLLSLNRCVNLTTLTLTGYASNEGIGDLPSLPSLTSLDLFVTNIRSLSGLRSFEKITSLSIFRASRLENIDALRDAKATLHDLELDSCKRISNYGVLGALTELLKLRITKCAAINSLSFLRTLAQLEFFSFVGTNIKDGDISACFGIPYVGFDDRRHYNHKFAEFSPISDSTLTS